MKPLQLRSWEFRREREAEWRNLEELLARVEDRGAASLGARDLMQLARLHRAALSSLSVARAISLDRNLLDYLDALAARSHRIVYGSRRHLGGAVARFFADGFPRAVRDIRHLVALAALFFLCGVVTAAALVHSDAAHFYDFVSSAYAQGRDPAASTEELKAVLYGGARTVSDQLTAFASVLFSHNAQIGILSFALGFAAGIPVFLLLFANGLILGAFAELYRGRGLGRDFWLWLLPHGITELSAMVLCGAAGLSIAEALVFPGRHTRIENLALRGREAGKVVLGAACMFFVAALIEGIFRQTVQSMPVRAAVAGGTVLLWIAYFTRSR